VLVLLILGETLVQVVLRAAIPAIFLWYLLTAGRRALRPSTARRSRIR
jgi:hypothetical protein